jgi:hypothetical protein
MWAFKWVLIQCLLWAKHGNMGSPTSMEETSFHCCAFRGWIAMPWQSQGVRDESGKFSPEIIKKEMRNG